jgi:hypothetical protein
MARVIEISEDTAIQKIHDWLCEADGDEFARIIGEMFGGECWQWIDGEYHFEPNENYFGAFGPAEK